MISTHHDLTRSIEFLRELVAFASVSVSSNVAISDHVAGILRSMGFEIERNEMLDEFGTKKINLIARRDPSGSCSGPGLAYFCHTDVVPAEHWTGPGGDPFVAIVTKDRVYGRGACDMKGSLAAMLAAVASIDPRQQTAPIWVVCTADEERHMQGARHIVAHSAAYRELTSRDPVALIGEPTCCRVTNAHKGIVGFKIHSQGRAAHSSTTDGINANVAMVPMLQTLLELNNRCESDPSLRNNDFNPPTLSWNFGVSDQATAINIVPDRSTAWVMYRTMPGVDGAELVQIVRKRADELGLRIEIGGDCQPLMTSPDDPKVRILCQIAATVHGDGESRTACYATDGAVLTSLSHRVIIGPGDIAQAHTTDEFIELEQLRQGIELYRRVIEHFAAS